MRKEVLSMLAAISLFTGCEHVNQVQTPTEVQAEKNEPIVEENKTIDLKNEIATFYADWKDTKYKAGGTTKAGIDSAALTQRFFKDKLELDIPRRAYQQAKLGEKIDKKDLQAGDIIILKRKKEYYTGVYIGENEFLHSSFQGVKIEKLDDKPYAYTYYSARRIF